MELKRTVGVRPIALSDVKHIKVHYDDHLYMFAPNRGGIWNFGDGEIALAYIATPMDYASDLPPGFNRHGGGPRSFRGSHEKWGSESGVMLSRSLDGGETWERVDVGDIPPGRMMQVAIDPANPSRVCCTAYSGEVYSSNDGGLNWDKSMLPVKTSRSLHVYPMVCG